MNDIVEAVRAAKVRRDYSGAQQTLVNWVRETIAKRYPWLEVTETPSGLVGRFRDQPLLRMELTIHQVVTGENALNSQHAREIGQAITRLTATEAGAKVLVVMDGVTRKAVFDQFADQMIGVQVWLAAELTTREITFVG